MRIIAYRRHRTSLVVLFCIIAVVMSGAAPWQIGLEPRAGLAEPRPKQTANLGTPVPQQKPGEQAAGEDPLDGDPLDGKPANDDPDLPRNAERLAIERSGRPNSAPSSLVAYDDDTSTVWEADEDEPWLWLDLGDERQVRQIRWLARGAGTIEVAVSNDRERWQVVESADVDQGWQGVELREDARFVRLTLQATDDSELPELAEVSVYGQDDDQSADRAQKAKKGGKDKKSKNDRKNSNGKDDTANSNKSDKGDRKEKPARDKNSRNDGTTTETENVSAQSGETDCDGKRARCRTRQGKVDVVDECGTDGTCTIDVQADGGSAQCDALGGNEAEAGRGNGKRAADGGRCEAVADGGAVTIGDIDP